MHKRLCVILRNACTCFEYLTEAVLCMLASLLYCEAQHEPGRAPKAAGRTWPRPPRSGTFLGSCEWRLRNVQGGKGRGQTCTGACVCNLFEQIDTHEQRHSLTGVDDHLQPQTISMHSARNAAACDRFSSMNVTVKDVAEINRWLRVRRGKYGHKRHSGHLHVQTSNAKTVTDSTRQAEHQPLRRRRLCKHMGA